MYVAMINKERGYGLERKKGVVYERVWRVKREEENDLTTANDHIREEQQIEIDFRVSAHHEENPWWVNLG